MRKFLMVSVVLAGCTTAQTNTALNSTAGQLFCAIQTSGGGTIVAALIDGAASAAAPAAAPIAVLATNATQTFVDNACAQAAVNEGAVAGVPVSPPANPAAAPTVAVLVAKVAS